MALHSRAKIRIARALRHMRPSHLVSSRLTQRVISEFADKAGLVYFGTVHQHDEDHRLVRGHTVSATHIDHHYCVGSVRGYDVTLVSRNDVITLRSTLKQQRCHWLICTIDLHTKVEVPHLYVGHRDRDEAFRSSFEQLSPVHIGALAPYGPKFLSEYSVYTRPTNSLLVEQIITPQIGDIIAAHFQYASIEIEDNTIYLYVENEKPTEAQLDKLLSNGLWLAEAIDAALMPSVVRDEG